MAEAYHLQSYVPAINFPDEVLQLAKFLESDQTSLIQSVALHGWLCTFARIGKGDIPDKDHTAKHILCKENVHALYSNDGRPKAILVCIELEGFHYLWSELPEYGWDLATRTMGMNEKKYTFAALPMELYNYMRVRCDEEAHPADTVKTMWLDTTEPLPQNLPNGLHLSSMSTMDDVHAANNTWAYKRPGSLELIQFMVELEMLPTVAVRSSDEKVVSWAFTYPNGSLGMAYTLESHRRLGLAAICISSLAATHVRDRGYCFVYVVEGNTASEAMLRKLSFRHVDDVKWVRFIRKASIS